MRRTCSMAAGGSGRAGVALIGTLAVLAVVSVLLMTIGAQMLSNRRLAERRAEQLQADWLARAGVELAIGRLLAAEGYTGETTELIPRSEVRVTVGRDEKSPGTFRVVSEARFPTDTREVVMRSVTRLVRRVKDGDRIRIEALPVDEAESR
jgi:hypothetical protein